MKISAKIIIAKVKIKINNEVLSIFCDISLNVSLILYEKKPILAPMEFIIISSASKLPRYVIIWRISNVVMEIKKIKINLRYLILNIIGISIPKGTKANKLPKLKNHKSESFFGYHNGILVGIIEKR